MTIKEKLFPETYPRIMKTIYGWMSVAGTDFEELKNYGGIKVAYGIICSPGWLKKYREICGEDKIVLVHIGADSMIIPGEHGPEGPVAMYNMLKAIDGFVKKADGTYLKYRFHPEGGESICINMTNPEVQSALANFVSEHILDIPEVDGLHLDNLWDSLYSPGAEETDFDGNGVPDEPMERAARWQYGTQQFLQNLRALQPDKLIVGNGRWTEYSDVLNGGEYEWFPNYRITTYWSSWRDTMFRKDYSISDRRDYCLMPMVNILHLGLYDHETTDKNLMDRAIISSILAGDATFITPAKGGVPHYSYIVENQEIWTPEGPTRRTIAKRAFSSDRYIRKWFPVYTRMVRNIETDEKFYATFNPNETWVRYRGELISGFGSKFVKSEHGVPIPIQTVL